MAKTNPEKNLSKELDNYSISEIIRVFSSIDEKIISLHKCSSDDFLNLNANLKKYHAESKSINKNADEVIEIISGMEREEVYHDLDELYHMIKGLLDRNSQKVRSLLEVSGAIQTDLDHLYIAINNYKQNAMTFRFLLKNLEIDNTIEGTNSKNTREDVDPGINQLIDHVKDRLTGLNEQVKQAKTENNNSVSKLEDFREKNLNMVSSLLAQIEAGTRILEQKNNETESKIPELKENTNITAENISKIITNLQYHDIIRQKIEHIQATHKNIIKELSLMEIVNHQNSIKHNKLKTFVQIRDIAGLQSAQLIHANKQYQEAISVITDKFQQIGKNMKVLADIFHQLLSNGKTSNQGLYNEIFAKLKEAMAISGKIVDQNSLTNQSVETSTSIYKALLTEVSKAMDDNGIFEHEINDLITNRNHSLDSGVVSQMLQLFDALKDSRTQLRSLVGSLEKNIEKQVGLSSSQNSFQSIRSDIDGFNLDMTQLIENLYQKGQVVKSLLLENKEASIRISSEIRETIKGVKYYDFFENVIEEIITELNQINQKLMSAPGDIEGKGSESLEQIKKLYTMKSEHLIHERVANGGFQDDDLFDDEEDENDSENLELF